MTEDVDCVIELATYCGLCELEEAIRKRGFTNEWYKPAFAHRQEVALFDGDMILNFFSLLAVLIL